MRAVGKFFRTAAIVVMLTGSYAATQAATASYSVTHPGAGLGKTEITHLSTSDQSLVFQVNVENASAEKFFIVIKDEGGSVIYRGSFSDKDFSKKFVLPKNESGKITFTIKSSSDVQSESFAINSNTRVIQEVVVTKVD
jgi:hypothetical protein